MDVKPYLSLLLSDKVKIIESISEDKHSVHESMMRF